MPTTKIPSPTTGMSIEDLNNLMFRYYRELTFLLNGNLDSANVREITTDLLVAGTAKISTALIEDLVVGGNVTMGANAYISWGNVTDQPDISGIAVGAIESTYIDAYGVWTVNVYANNIEAGTFSLINNMTIGDPDTGDSKSIVFYSGSGGGETGSIIASRDNYPTDKYAKLTIAAYDLYFSSFNRPQWGSSNIVIASDLSSYSLTSHNHDSAYATIGHDHGNTYVKTSQDIKIQYFADHMEISNDGGATWKVINYDA